MVQLELLKRLLNLQDESQNDLLQYYLDCASDVICDIRNTTSVEKEYQNIQVRIAIELYNKQGVEGQTYHMENGISRTYESADISPSLLREITPFVKTPFTTRRVVTQ